MNTKRPAWFLVAAVVLTGVWWLFVHPASRSARPPGSSAAPPTARLVPERVFPARRTSGGSVEQAGLPLTELPGQAGIASVAVGNVLERAIDCARIIEDRIQRFPPTSSDRDHFKELQRRLFTDDYTVAMGMAELDCHDADAVFADLKAALRSGATPSATSRSRPPASSASPSVSWQQRLSRVYGLWFQSSPDYAPILTQLRLLTRDDPLASDLFKDAVLFVALWTQVNDWKHDDAAWIEGLTPGAGVDPAAAALWDEILEAYREIFSFRFREIHGLEGEAAVETLSSLTLRNVGPDVRVPCP